MGGVQNIMKVQRFFKSSARNAIKQYRVMRVACGIIGESVRFCQIGVRFF